MSSVTEIETAIQKLSVAEQRAIALHLGERLLDEKSSGGCAVADEGIRFLSPYDLPCTSGIPKPKAQGKAKATR